MSRVSKPFERSKTLEVVADYQLVSNNIMYYFTLLSYMF